MVRNYRALRRKGKSKKHLMRRHRQRKNHMCVHDVTSSKRLDALKEMILDRSGRILDKNKVQELADRGMRIFNGAATKNDPWLGAQQSRSVWEATGIEGDLLRDIDRACNEQRAVKFSSDCFIEGETQVTTSSPWLLSIRGSSPHHTDLLGHVERELGGHYRGATTLYYVLKLRGQGKFKIWNQQHSSHDADRLATVYKGLGEPDLIIDLKEGSFIEFPSRLIHQADSRNTRLVASLIFNRSIRAKKKIVRNKCIYYLLPCVRRRLSIIKLRQ